LNYNKEPYPKDIAALFNKAKVIADEIIVLLNKANCKTLNELYKEDDNGSVKRQFNIFNELGFKANVYNGKSHSPKGHNEFKGIYVFGEEINGRINPVYVGISRTVYRRLRQHGFGKKHNECSLAYLITKKQRNAENKVTARATITNTQLNQAKERIRNMQVALYPMSLDFDLYFLEVAIAGILKTKWNSFRTH